MPISTDSGRPISIARRLISSVVLLFAVFLLMVSVLDPRVKLSTAQRRAFSIIVTPFVWNALLESEASIWFENWGIVSPGLKTR